MRRDKGQRRLACAQLLIMAGTLTALPCAAEQLTTSALSLVVDAESGSYQVAFAHGPTIVAAQTAAEVDHHWLRCSDYPHHVTVRSRFRDELGSGGELTVTCRGLSHKPELIYSIRVYEQEPYATVQVRVLNTTGRQVSVQAVRGVEAVGQDILALRGPVIADRVLSDDLSEDVRATYDLGDAPDGMHRAVGSQLVYNRESKQSFLVAALTSKRFATVIRLQADTSGPTSRIVSFSADSTGTTEVQRDGALLDAPTTDQVELSLPLHPGEELDGERLLLEAGPNYLDQLTKYGEAVRKLNHARVSTPTPIGWWSWTAYYAAINEGETLANADWQSRHLKALGYRYLQVDEGYQYARGEYTTSNAEQFPSGMRAVGHHVTGDGLIFGVWTAPFQVSSRAWVYEQHKDWLVKNAQGKPIVVGKSWGDLSDRMYALDTTHPGAQEYLRQTYRTMVREWGIRFIKLDFMDAAAIEGYRHRPNTTGIEAWRTGLQVIRNAVGEDVVLDKDGSLDMLTPVGLVDTGRISADTFHAFKSTKEAAPAIAAYFYTNRNFFVNDPDAFNTTGQQFPDFRHADPNLPLAAAEASIALSAVSGGMYEIGDDMLVLGSQKDRLALVQNQDLLNMAKLGRASTPIDLMSYRPEDGQPSIFFLRETPRQSILTVFNWAKEPRSRTVKLVDLGLPASHAFIATNVLRSGSTRLVRDGSLELQNEEPESVTVLKLIDNSVPERPPTATALVPNSADAGKTFEVSARADSDDAGVIEFSWDFGDGTGAEGAHASHTYTRAAGFIIKLTVYAVDGSKTELTFPVTVTGMLKAYPKLSTNRRRAS